MGLLTFNAIAQEVQKQEVDSAWWQNKTDQLNYEEKDRSFKQIDNLPQDISWVDAPIIKYSVLFIIIVILLFILYKLFLKGLIQGDYKTEEKVYRLLHEKDLDDHFYEMDLEQLLADLIKASNWKSALRIRFLMVLKALIEAKKIKWHKDLTNLQIVYQLDSDDSKRSLLHLVQIFERNWYGDLQATKAQFENYDREVALFLMLIKQGNSGE
jgi:hypothetical protein